MKKLLIFPLTAFLALPVFAGTSKTTTTRSYDSTTTSPIMGTERDSEMIESQEEFDDSNLNQRDIDQQRMEDQWHNDRIEQERMEESLESEESIDYNDRTRTNRERKALNTSSDASDDQ
jgi:uncharacterized protein YycO